MKLVRPLFIALAILMAATVAGLGLVLTPAFQRWVVRRVAADHPDLKLEVDDFAAGFSSVTVRGMRLEQNGLHLSIDQLDAECAMFQMLFGRQLSVHRLAARGVVLDASRLSRAKASAIAAGGPAAATGLLARLELPVAVVLDDCQAAGRALLPGAAGHPPVETEFKITGGKFAPGQEGVLQLAATLRNPVADAKVAALNAQVSLRAYQTFQRSFQRVDLTAIVDAEGTRFSEKNQLKLAAELTKDTNGEIYSASVDTLIRGASENLLTVRATLPTGHKEFAGQWTLKGRTAQLEPFFLGDALPDFDVRGEGRFAFTPSTWAVSTQGSLEAVVSRLEAIEPAWRAIGLVKLQAQFDLAEADGMAQLRQLDVRLTGEQPVLTIQATRAAEFNLKERRLQVGGDEAGEILNLKLNGLPLAWVRPFVHSVDVSGGMITGEFVVTAEKGRLRVKTVERVHVNALSFVQRGRLLLAKTDVMLDVESTLTGPELQVKINELALQTLAGDSITAHGSVAVPLIKNPPFAITASYAADLPELFSPWLRGAHVKVSGETDLNLAGSRIEMHRFNTMMSDVGGQTLLAASLIHPFSFDTATRRATAGEKGSIDLMRLTLSQLPFQFPRVGQSNIRLGGRLEQGEFVLTADGEKLKLETVSPLELTGVSLAQGDQVALTGLTIEAKPTIELNGASTNAVQTGDILIRTVAGNSLATLKGETTQSLGTGRRGNLTFSLEVPALASQPLFAGAQAISQGRASGEIRMALGPVSQVEARLTVNGLVVREGGQTLPVANLSFRALAQENGKISVQAPLLLDRAGQRSDLNLSLVLTPAGRALGVDGSLAGEHVELADLVAMLGVFSVVPANPGSPVPKEAATGAIVDPAAVWSRFGGQILLELKSATWGKNWSMTGLKGQVVFDPTRAAMPKLEAAFGEKGRLAANGELRFTAGGEPYRLTGDFSLTEFDAGKLFKAIEPDRPATVEGIFGVVGHFDGTGATVDDTVQRTRGRFEMTSRQGVFRGLQRSSNKLSMTSKAVGLGASVLGSILGADKATKVAEKVAGTAYFVDQLAQIVGELNYDQLSVRLGRDQSLNLTLEDFSLVAPEVRLLGKGTVTYAAGKPLLEQPLDASFSFATRGKTEQIFGKLRLIDGTRDELGYARSQLPVTIGGTLARPDPSAFFTRVATAKLSDLLAPED